MAHKGLQTSLIKDEKIQEKIKNITKSYVEANIDL